MDTNKNRIEEVNRAVEDTRREVQSQAEKMEDLETRLERKMVIE